ncbi:MAG: hypothetical protein HPY87_09020 [Fervidobacterium sp.]|uniref:hypothetical protein n=1 Tax=Fervidobacterium sp. TaxID=1871331 RepID=UPI0025C62862|nr:hypothetical protein [Fervidobacterium sp.]NPU90002.1 hypothetical protein [Fervidobacterium sp.]
MSDRTVPFDKDEACDVCGKIGAFDFMGVLLCPECARNITSKDSDTPKIDRLNDELKMLLYMIDNYPHIDYKEILHGIIERYKGCSTTNNNIMFTYYQNDKCDKCEKDGAFYFSYMSLCPNCLLKLLYNPTDDIEKSEDIVIRSLYMSNINSKSLKDIVVEYIDALEKEAIKKMEDDKND